MKAHLQSTRLDQILKNKRVTPGCVYQVCVEGVIPSVESSGNHWEPWRPMVSKELRNGGRSVHTSRINTTRMNPSTNICKVSMVLLAHVLIRVVLLCLFSSLKII